VNAIGQRMASVAEFARIYRPLVAEFARIWGVPRHVPSETARRPHSDAFGHHSTNRPTGFTLIEILIATVLSAALLVVLWGLFGVYSKLFEKGQDQVSRAQLTRALWQQLSEDLHAAIEDSPGDNRADEWADPFADAAPVRRFGLLGTRSTLQIDVLQVIPPEEGPALDADVTGSSLGASALQVPELRTIFYTFVESGRAEDESAASPFAPGPIRPGLTRYELDFETPYGDELAAQFDEGLSATVPLPAEAYVSDASEIFSQDGSVLWMPEIVRLEFRYFDGSGWSTAWDSLQRKSLPAAVEVTLQVKPFEEPDPDASAAQAPQETALDKEDAEFLEPIAPQLDTADLRVYRLVIDLPSSQQYAAARRAESVARVDSRRLPTPLAAPRLSVSKRPARSTIPAAIQPDQWIRVEP